MDVRWYNHTYELDHNTHPNKHLQNAWNKYGKDNFKFEIIITCSESDNLNDIEKKYITLFNSNNQLKGYNLTSGGEGYKLNEEIKNKISISKRGQKSDLSFADVRKIKMLMYCSMDRKEIAKIFNTNAKVLTSISTGANYSYILPHLNKYIHNMKKRLIDERNEDILRLYDSGLTIKNIKDSTNYTRSVIEKCIYQYRAVNKKYDLRKLSFEQEQDVVKKYFEFGNSIKELAQLYNVSTTTIRYIISYYKNVLVS